MSQGSLIGTFYAVLAGVDAGPRLPRSFFVGLGLERTAEMVPRTIGINDQ